MAAERPTYIIIDALDECPDISGMPTLREVVLDFVEDPVRQRLPNVHVCATSRPEINFKTVLEPLATYTISIHEESGQKEDITNDIFPVVHPDSKMPGWRDEDKKLVFDVISEERTGCKRIAPFLGISYLMMYCIVQAAQVCMEARPPQPSSASEASHSPPSVCFGAVSFVLDSYIQCCTLLFYSRRCK